MIVVDASAALSGLLNDGSARRTMAEQPIHVPHLIDSEIANGLRRSVTSGRLYANVAWTILDRWRHLGTTRYAVFSFLERIWELRETLSAYDASYVALAEQLSCALLTADARLSRARGARCPMIVVPR